MPNCEICAKYLLSFISCPLARATETRRRSTLRGFTPASRRAWLTMSTMLCSSAVNEVGMVRDPKTTGGVVGMGEDADLTGSVLVLFKRPFNDTEFEVVVLINGGHNGWISKIKIKKASLTDLLLNL